MTKRKITINRKPNEESKIVETDVTKTNFDEGLDEEYIDEELHTLRYQYFLLFLEYLKAKKLGKQLNGGWVHNNFRARQNGRNYDVTLFGEKYSITPEKSDDISDIIAAYF